MGSLNKKTAELNDIISDYSTAEQKTGRKWTDGRDVYKKTFDAAWNGATGSQSLPHGVANFDKMVKFVGHYVEHTVAADTPAIPLYLDNYEIYFSRADATNLYGYIGAGWVGDITINRLVFTIEYIKTP